MHYRIEAFVDARRDDAIVPGPVACTRAPAAPFPITGLVGATVNARGPIECPPLRCAEPPTARVAHVLAAVDRRAR